jgi:hypothetical protein
VFPFALLSIIEIGLGIGIWVFTGKNVLPGKDVLHIGPMLILGVLPISGPGQYFITLLFQFIFVFPLIYYCYKKNPAATVISCFIISLVYELSASYILGRFGGYDYVTAAIPKYLSAIALGVWISDDFGLFARRNRFILFGAVLSIVYLFTSDVVAFPYAEGSYSSIVPFFLPVWFTNNFISYFYAALLVLVGIKYLPATTKNLAVSVLAYCGKASYHVFLVQMVYFTFIRYINDVLAGNVQSVPLAPYVVVLLGNIIICLVCGVVFYRLEYRLRILLRKLLKKYHLCKLTRGR